MSVRTCAKNQIRSYQKEYIPKLWYNLYETLYTYKGYNQRGIEKEIFKRKDLKK